ncbi:hypothetical protein ABMA70_12345 [Halobacteriovorax sp. XZX-3]|uniref:hypothetical protein n=1 Tax=unclassified Halobacteriovorax TaxID=2639665 RepID=UPI003722CAEA
MKKLITFIAALFVTTSVFAGMPNENDSWETIKDNFMKVTFNEPALNLDNGGAISVFFGCIDGDTIRTKKMLKRCVEWQHRGGDRDSICTAYTSFYGRAEIVTERERCVRWSLQGRRDGRDICLEYETYSYTHPLSYDIDVHKTLHGRRHDNKLGRKLFTKNYTIEACE